MGRERKTANCYDGRCKMAKGGFVTVGRWRRSPQAVLDWRQERKIRSGVDLSARERS